MRQRPHQDAILTICHKYFIFFYAETSNVLQK